MTKVQFVPKDTTDPSIMTKIQFQAWDMFQAWVGVKRSRKPFMEDLERFATLVVAETAEQIKEYDRLLNGAAEREYTRGNEHEREIAKQDAEITRLRAELAAERERCAKMEKALRTLLWCNDNCSPFGGEIHRDRIDRAWDEARAAIPRDHAEGETSRKTGE